MVSLKSKQIFRSLNSLKLPEMLTDKAWEARTTSAFGLRIEMADIVET